MYKGNYHSLLLVGFLKSEQNRNGCSSSAHKDNTDKDGNLSAGYFQVIHLFKCGSGAIGSA